MASVDDELIDSCSPATANGYQSLLGFLSDDRSTAIDGVAYYALDFVDYSSVREYLESDIDIRRQNAENTFPVQENANRIWYLCKLFEDFAVEGWRDRDIIHKFVSSIERDQTKEGRIPGPIDTADKLRVLSLVKPEDQVTADAERYCRNHVDDILENSNDPVTAASLLVLAFSEINFERYRDRIAQLTTYLVDSQADEGYFGRLREDPAEPDAPRYLPIEETSLAVSALSRTENHERAVDTAIEWILEEQRDNGEWKQNEAVHHRSLHHPAISTAFALLALVQTRKGPMVSQGQAKWQLELRTQERDKERPHFVETFPTPDLDTRTREIDERIAAMIQSAEQRVRISSLQIDKHHDRLLDLIEKGVQVQVLSRMEQPRGERKKMKRAVMNDLIKQSGGQVRGTNLNHARMVIVDKRELLVSSADLTRDQLIDEFNAGLYTRSQEAVEEASSFFDRLWEEAEPLDVN